MVERRHGAAARGHQPEDEEARRDLLAVEGEVFAAHHRLLDGAQALAAEGLFGHAIELGNRPGVIECHRVVDAVVEFGGAAVRGGDTGGDLLEPSHHQLLHRGRERPGRAADDGARRDDVEPAAGIDHGDRDHHGIEWTDAAAGDGLHRLHDGRRRHHRIAAGMRPRRVSADARDDDLEAIAGGEERSHARADDAKGVLRPAMQSEDALDRRTDHAPVEAAILDHPLAAAATFFGRLEEKRNRVRQRIRLRQTGQHASGAEQDGGMAVMTAGVHGSGGRAPIRKLALLLNWKRVHVGPQSDRPRSAPRQMAKDPGSSGEIGLEGHPRLGQFALHHRARAALLVPQFRVGVKVVTDRHQLRHFLSNQRADGGGGNGSGGHEGRW